MNSNILPELENMDYIFDLQSNYSITFCPVEAVNELVEFIDTHWRKNHIFVISRELLNWQHLNELNNRYNFVIARENNTKQIHSILGFVPTSQFDHTLISAHEHIWPCIWKVREDVKAVGLGISLYYYLVNQLHVETLSILGSSRVALSIYKKWNFTTGKIAHHFMLNSTVKEFKLVGNYLSFQQELSVFNDNICSFDLCSLEQFLSLGEDVFGHVSKYKSKNYYINRFYKHPLYSYTAYSIKKNKVIKAVFFIRECIANTRKALRIVDFVGNIFYLIGNARNFQSLMVNLSAEYIDFINVGLSERVLEESGFTNKSETDLVISNYFEPYVSENIELDYAFKSVDTNQKVIFFKADADQDRPNLL